MNELEISKFADACNADEANELLNLGWKTTKELLNLGLIFYWPAANGPIKEPEYPAKMPDIQINGNVDLAK